MEVWYSHAKQTDTGIGEVIWQGWRAYAMKQVWYKVRIMYAFKSQWGMKADVYDAQTSSAVNRGVEESDTDIKEAIIDGQSSTLMETPNDVAMDA